MPSVLGKRPVIFEGLAMLVLIGPSYEATEAELDALTRETGLGPYDLKSRLRPGAWGVVRAIANEAEAEDLVLRLLQAGLPACALPSSVGQDANRRVIYLRGLGFSPDGVSMRFAEREMAVPYGALLVIVRGEVHMGRQLFGASPSSPGLSLRPTSASGLLVAGDLASEVRSTANEEVFAAADIHFATVSWIARIDARDLVFPNDYIDVQNVAERLDRCIDDLAATSSIRVDRAMKTSSLASHSQGSQRAPTSGSGVVSGARGANGLSDECFDAYSRMVGEAERRLFAGL